MKKGKKIFWLAVTSSFALGLLARAEEAPPEQQEQVRAAINAIKQNKIVAILELPADEEETFLVLYNEWEEVRWAHTQRRDVLLDELRTKMADLRAGRELMAILDDLDNADADSRTAEENLRADFRDVLSDEQYAKLLLFEDDFNRNLRRLVQEKQRAPEEELKK